MEDLKRNKFLPLIIHELRSPINLILSHINKGLKTLNQPEIVKEQLESIYDLSNFLLLTVNDILEMCKIANNKLLIVTEDFNLNEILEQFHCTYECLCAQKKLKFTLMKENLTIHNLMGDSLRLMTILGNILSNAYKFTPEGGEIKVIVNQELMTSNKVRVNFEITDTGIGIDQEFLKEIFKPYTQEHQNCGGTGLGMMMVKELVDLMNGTINVTSEIGIGTTFLLTLDFDKSVLKNEEVFDFTEKRVLVVDDNTVNLEFTNDLLEMTNITVETASNGREALEKFSSSPENYYDVILMDLNMPIMDGYQSAKTIRGLSRIDAKTVKIMALTASATDSEVKLVKNSGMDDFIQKPINVKSLFKTINEHFKK